MVSKLYLLPTFLMLMRVVSYTVCHKPQRIVGRKGKKAVETLSSADRGKTITAVCCVNACGTFIPPMLIFPRVRFKPELTDKAPNGTTGAASKTGRINEELFNKWFNHSVSCVKPKARLEPVVLIMDGHSCHTKNLQLIDSARENNVILVSLPSHCTHRLQPLDISFFKSMNTFYDAQVQAWLRQHPGRVLTEYQVGELFDAAYGKAATVQNGSSGFRKAGIFPFRRDVFTDEDFLCSKMTDTALGDAVAVDDARVNEDDVAPPDQTHNQSDVMQVPSDTSSTHPDNLTSDSNMADVPVPAVCEEQTNATTDNHCSCYCH